MERRIGESDTDDSGRRIDVDRVGDVSDVCFEVVKLFPAELLSIILQASLKLRCRILTSSLSLMFRFVICALFRVPLRISVFATLMLVLHTCHGDVDSEDSKCTLHLSGLLAVLISYFRCCCSLPKQCGCYSAMLLYICKRLNACAPRPFFLQLKPQT